MPAAVIWPVKSRPKALAASMTARYPATFAIDERTSIDCAREILGTASMATDVTPIAASRSTASGLQAGSILAMRVAPRRILRSLASLGVSSEVMMSAAQTPWASTIWAPASRYCSSG